MNVIQVVKYFKEQQEGEIGSHAFLVRKKKVLEALYWLKKYNILYQDITIDEGNLNWMENCDKKGFNET